MIMQELKFPDNLKINPKISTWVSFVDDGTISLRTGKVEIGQGAVTAIAAIAAKELGIGLDQLRIVAGDTRLGPNEGFTAGSFSVEHGGSAMRWVCAIVRGLFMQAAAKQLNMPLSEMRIENGVFYSRNSNQGLSYGALRASIDLDREIEPLGMPVFFGGAVEPEALQRLDLKTRIGGAGFIQDMRLPGMLYGRVLRALHPHDQLATFDQQAITQLPGVKDVVIDGHFAGVVAERDDQALDAIAKATKSAKWHRTLALPETGGNDWMDAYDVRTSSPTPDLPAKGKATTTFKARYSRPYLAHASIGPSCAIAHWNAGRLTVWSHTQGVFPLRAQLARALHLELSQVDVIHAPGAGCYGHNGADDVALDAALLARGLNAPVMCLWTRAQELSCSPFGAPMTMEVEAGLNANGKITGWTHQVWSPPHIARPNVGDGVNLRAAWDLAEPHAPAPPNDIPPPQSGGARNAIPLYAFDGQSIVHHLLPQGPLRSSALRSLGAHGNVFAIESFMDEMAGFAGTDPLAFRLAHLEDPRAIAVLKKVAALANWNPQAAGGDGKGRGIGWARYKNSGGYCAIIAEVEVDAAVLLTRVYAAIDVGEVAHRNGLLNQIEGGIVQAASWTLKEAVKWEHDELLMRSWDDYPILNFSETPDISIAVIEQPGVPALGAGEVASGPTAAAIANAVAHAIGVRVRDMPLTPERIAAAINAT